MNLPLPVNDTVGPSVPMKYGANGKTAKNNVYSPIFVNFSQKSTKIIKGMYDPKLIKSGSKIQGSRQQYQILFTIIPILQIQNG